MKLLKVALLQCLVLLLTSADDHSPVPCSPRCVCFADDDDVLTAKCSIKNGEKHVLVLPDTIQNLDLSNNNLTEVPSWAFSHMRNITQLRLANNHISRIKENSFKDLLNLQFIDISNNDVSRWDAVRTNELTNLKFLEISGNTFIPGQQFLRLPMLKIINGVTWNKACKDCLLVKTDAIEELTANQSFEFYAIFAQEHYKYHEEISYGMSLFFVKNGFSPQCLVSRAQCYNEEIDRPYDMSLNLIIRQLFYVEYALGFIAIGLNLIVVFTITFSRPLCKPSFILICNVALCDLMMGIYTVLIGRYTVYEFIVNEGSYEGMDTFVNPYCTAMGFIFTTAQVVAVPTSLLVTVERFLSIVYCMDPAKRLRKKLAITLVISFWCCGIAYAVLPLFRVGGLRYHGEFTCMLPFVDGPDASDVNTSTLVVAVLLSVLYIISISLYLPIYRFVKKSNNTAGVRRKATLAKNIAVMIATNFIFNLLPLISTLIFVYCYNDFMVLLKVNTLKKLKTYFIFLSWLPVVFLSINSCLNPFLCAFRHPKFKYHLFLFFKRVKHVFSKEEVENSHSDISWKCRSVDGIELALSNSKDIEMTNLSFSNHISPSMLSVATNNH